MELPPRTLRIPAWLLFGAPRCGTTSAHAENTSEQTAVFPAAWNYLRARGEYAFPGGSGEVDMELPPRTRRILFVGG